MRSAPGAVRITPGMVPSNRDGVRSDRGGVRMAPNAVPSVPDATCRGGTPPRLRRGRRLRRALASALHRSIKTIETYRSRIRAKLRLKNPTALAQWARQFVHGARARSSGTQT